MDEWVDASQLWLEGQVSTSPKPQLGAIVPMKK